MTIYFVGSEDIDFAGVLLATTANYSSTFSRGSVYNNESASPRASGIYTPNGLGADITQGWLHFYSSVATVSGATAYYFASFVKSGESQHGIGVRRSLTGANCVLFADDGTGTILTSPTFSIASGAHYYDIHVNIVGTAATVSLYIDGVLLTSYTFTLVSTYTLDDIRLSGGSTTASWGLRFSQVIVADVSTIGWRVKTLEPTGNGTDTAWIGDYTGVDEFNVDLADNVTTGSAASELFTNAAYAPTDTEVKAVAVSSYALTTTIDDYYHQLRVSGTNYDSALFTLTGGYLPYLSIFETNPATSAAWSVADAGSTALEFGVRAA